MKWGLPGRGHTVIWRYVGTGPCGSLWVLIGHGGSWWVLVGHGGCLWVLVGHWSFPSGGARRRMRLMNHARLQSEEFGLTALYKRH